jgi:hypothetical protein
VVIDEQGLADIVEQRTMLVEALRAGYEAIRFDYES